MQLCQNNFSSQQFLFKKQNNFNETATKTSFRISHPLAKREKAAFADRNLIIKCIVQAVEKMCSVVFDTRRS